MSRSRWIVGNWKLNGSLLHNAELIAALLAGLADTALAHVGPQVGVCMPFPYLSQAQQLMTGSSLRWGAQDVSEQAQGAYTGEVSATMLKEFGASIVIVGHSERRARHGETSELVAAKTQAALAAGLMPIVCVGETQQQRQAGETFEVLSVQMRPIVSIAAAQPIVIAYEPVWAIGTGQSASPEQAQHTHAFLRTLLIEARAGDTAILYGGSVNADNAAALFAMADIDGGLIGGASLVAEDFLAIVSAAGSTATAQAA